MLYVKIQPFRCPIFLHHTNRITFVYSTKHKIDNTLGPNKRCIKATLQNLYVIYYNLLLTERETLLKYYVCAMGVPGINIHFFINRGTERTKKAVCQRRQYTKWHWPMNQTQIVSCGAEQIKHITTVLIK